MAKSVQGDPKIDVAAKKAFKVIDDIFYASNQFKASNLKNYDIETLKKMSDISRDFSLASKYITFRLEQSDGSQKAQINSLERRISALEEKNAKTVTKAAPKVVKTKPKQKPKPKPKLPAAMMKITEQNPAATPVAETASN